MSPRPPEFRPDETLVADLAEAVYRDRLGAGGAEQMIAADEDNGQKLRGRAQIYAPIVRSVLVALEARKASP